jgi:hypothetical protein
MESPDLARLDHSAKQIRVKLESEQVAYAIHSSFCCMLSVWGYGSV